MRHPCRHANVMERWPRHICIHPNAIHRALHIRQQMLLGQQGKGVTDQSHVQPKLLSRFVQMACSGHDLPDRPTRALGNQVGIACLHQATDQSTQLSELS